MSIKKQYHDLQKASQTHLGWQWLLQLSLLMPITYNP